MPIPAAPALAKPVPQAVDRVAPDHRKSTVRSVPKEVMEEKNSAVREQECLPGHLVAVHSAGFLAVSVEYCSTDPDS
jgi:hypothetical protein